MKKVWVSGLIALALIIGTAVYSYNQRQKFKKLKTHVGRVIASSVKAPSVELSESPNIKISVDSFESNEDIQDNDINTSATLDEECCAEEDLATVYDMLDEYIYGSESILGEHDSKKEKLPPYAWLRSNLTENYGYSPDIDLYIDLLRKQRDEESMSFDQLLTYARLNARYNPSADSRRLRALLEDFDKKNIIGFDMEYLPPGAVASPY